MPKRCYVVSLTSIRPTDRVCKTSELRGTQAMIRIRLLGAIIFAPRRAQATIRATCEMLKKTLYSLDRVISLSQLPFPPISLISDFFRITSAENTNRPRLIRSDLYPRLSRPPKVAYFCLGKSVNRLARSKIRHLSPHGTHQSGGEG